MPIRFPTRLFTTALIGGLAMLVAVMSRAMPDGTVDQIVARHVAAMLETPGGVAIAVRSGGRTRFYNYGTADRSRPVSSDALFDLASVGKVFDTSLLALADQRGELSLDDPVARHVVELQQGGNVRSFTLRQLATYTSGFVLPQDHPPWPQETFTLPQFIAALNGWSSDKDHEPGRQMIYSHAGFVLLHLALERRFGMPYDELMKQRLLEPLGLRSTTLPVAAADATLHPRGEIPAALARRAVQAYSTDGTPTRAPGDVQGYYLWPGTGQMYASARDLAVFLTANLGELPNEAALQEAMRRTRQGVFPIDERTDQALAWEVHKGRKTGQETGQETGHETIVDKFGGMDNASAYIGLVRERKVGIVILGNRGNMAAWETGRRILRVLAQ